MWEVLGLVAGVFELIGLYLIGSKKKLGFILSMAGNIFWITFSISTRSAFGLIVVCLFAFFLNGRGYFNWKKGRV
jgi:hypothetical protein